MNMKQFFCDDKKNPSLMRAMSFIIIVFGIIAGIICIIISFTKENPDIVRELAVYSVALIGIGLTGKSIQKFAERD